MQKKWLYILVFLSSVAGMIWVVWNIKSNALYDRHATPEVCLFHKVTGLPCPSCGSTRSVMYITRFEFGEALYTNPIGFLLALGIVIFPFWVLYDVAARKQSFYRFYTTLEMFIRKRSVAIVLILLVVANWVWNICKFTS